MSHELRTTQPLIDLKIFASRAVLMTNPATLLLGYALFGLYFLVPFFVSSSPRNGYDLAAGPLGSLPRHRFGRAHRLTHL